MGRRFLLVLLALGSVAGFAAGIQSWRWRHEFGWGPHAGWHQGFAGDGSDERLDRLAEACVRAADRTRPSPTAPAPQPPPPPLGGVPQ